MVPSFLSDQIVESASLFSACFILSGGTEVEVTLNVASSPETAFRMSYMFCACASMSTIM